MNVEQRTELLRAITDCGHRITETRVTLDFDKSKPGNNALHQLVNRIDAALASPAAEPVQAPTMPITAARLRELVEEAFLAGSKKGSEVTIADLNERGLLLRRTDPLASPAATKEAKAGWIPVDERMPEPDSGEVLVWLTGGRCAFDEWHTYHEDPTGLGGATLDMGLMWRDYDYEEITHWMPLPPAPEGAA